MFRARVREQRRGPFPPAPAGGRVGGQTRAAPEGVPVHDPDLAAPEAPATPEALLALRGHPGVTPAAIRRALELAMAPPSSDAWHRFLDRTLLVLGALLVTSGIVFFFAFNWDALGRLERLGLVEAALLMAALAAWRLGPENLAGQVLLVVAAVLVGPLLGVYGQAYQTGADAYGLFLTWAALIVPWAVVGRNPVLSLLLLALANVAAWLAWDQLLAEDMWDSANFHLALFAGNGVVWAVWELARRRAPGPLAPSWTSRALALLCLLHVTFPSWMALVDDPSEGRGLALLLLAATLVAIFRLLRLRDRDLFLPAVGLAAAISVVTVGASRVLLFDTDAWLFGTLAIGVLILVQVAAAAAWLRRAGRSS